MMPVTTSSQTEQIMFISKTGGQNHQILANGSYILLGNNTTIPCVWVDNHSYICQPLEQPPFRDSELNELLYVVIVIMFYATALITLIITQIKRQRREGMEVDYYDEYLQRNSQVKQTCLTANDIISGRRDSIRPPLSLSVATTVLPKHSSSLLPSQEQPASIGAACSDDIGWERHNDHKTQYVREGTMSMLETIPDEEV